MEKIAIIGMGTAGMAVAAAYEKEVDTSKLEIDCYDRVESFGKGYPYTNDSDHILLNLKTRKISYNYEDNDDLYNWLEEEGREIKEYTSRSTFGEYTRSRLKDTMEKIGAKAIKEKIIRMDYLEGESKWEIESKGGLVKKYDRVHLCAGELAQKDAYRLEGIGNYYGQIYPVEEKLSDLGQGKATIIGMGLTAVDVASYLLEESSLDKIYMFSRTNLIPTVRVDPVDIKTNIMTYEKTRDLIDKNNGYISFESFDKLFNQELESHGINYEEFLKKHMSGGIDALRTNIEEPEDLAKVQALLPPMNLTFNLVWASMGEKDRVKFRKKYHPFMCLNRSPLPLISAEQLIKGEEESRLEVLENIKDIKYNHKEKLFEIKDCFGETQVKSDYVLNATGLDTSMEDIEDFNPLLDQILDKRYVQVDKYGGFTLDPRDMAAISPRFGKINNLHVHGVLASGVQYRNNSTLIIQKTAHDLIKKLYD